MRLSSVKSVVDYGRWAAQQGFVVSEGPKPFGPISPTAHSSSSLHYDFRALDINYRTWEHDRWDTEHEALMWLYRKTLRYRRFHVKWPLDEMFFDDRGFIKERGVGFNYPIDNHEDHLHIGFVYRQW